MHARTFRIVSELADLDGLDGPVRDLVDRCLAKDPRERPALGALLGGVLADPPAGAWLRADIMAELSRRAAELLEVEDPKAEPLPSQGPAPTGPTVPPPHGGPCAPARRRTSAYLATGAAAAAVMVAAGALFVRFQDRDGGNAGTASDAAGKVPLGMVGTWEGRTGGLAAPSDRLRRITVRRVADVQTSESRALCEFEGVLREGGTTVRLDMRNVRALPQSRGCEQRMEVTLALEGEKVRWTGPEPCACRKLRPRRWKA